MPEKKKGNNNYSNINTVKIKNKALLVKSQFKLRLVCI